MRGICNKSGHTCAPFNLYHGSRASALNERPRPHTSRWNGSPVSSSSASRTAAPCGAFRFVPRPRGSAIVASHVTNRIKAASRHFARRRTTSLSRDTARPSQFREPAHSIGRAPDRHGDISRFQLLLEYGTSRYLHTCRVDFHLVHSQCFMLARAFFTALRAFLLGLQKNLF